MDDVIVITETVSTKMNEELQKLYDLLSSYKIELNKAKILSDLNFDGYELIAKTIAAIDNELQSIESMNTNIDKRVRSIIWIDEHIARKFDSLYYEITE